MTVNESLELSNAINNALQSDLSGFFSEMFPTGLYQKLKLDKQRNRVFNMEATLLTMINTMVSPDKSLRNSVIIYNAVHENNLTRIKNIQEDYSKQAPPKRRGRPRLKAVKIQKSKTEPISINTSAYSQSRTRLSLDYVNKVFLESAKSESTSSKTDFYGRKVYLTDGTYLQMQDSPAIQELFKTGNETGYPRGLLCVLINQSLGLVHDFRLGDHYSSELALLLAMIMSLPQGSLLLADDLYNCFAVFSLLKSQNVDIIVPGKRKRNYKVIRQISEGDEIVEVTAPSKYSEIFENYEIPEKTLQLRRLEIPDINNPEKSIVLFTTILDKKISKTELYLKYLSRWDIEISIREIKTIMEVNILRSKSPEMALKELTCALIAYNYIRKIIKKAVQDTDFSPEEHIFPKCYSRNSAGYVDKLGRVYSRSSSGRYGDIGKKDS